MINDDFDKGIREIRLTEDVFRDMFSKEENYQELSTCFITLIRNTPLPGNDLSVKSKLLQLQKISLEMPFIDREDFWERFILFYKKTIKSQRKLKGVADKEEINLLNNPKLLDIVDKELSKKIEGEYINRKAVFLICCGVFVTNSNLASYNICANSNSGAGKDFLFKQILGLLPREMVVKRSRISPTAFTYWHNAVFEPDWTWDGKILLLSDISDSVLNHEVFKLMCSDETNSTITIKQKAVDIEINGKPILLITTAAANPNSEMLRRFPNLELDETIDQTQKIMERQANVAATGDTIEYNPIITKALSKLSRVKVKIPYASILPNKFTNEHIIMRTHFHRLLDYIKASAALFQCQRKSDEKGNIIAIPEDYDNARIVLIATTSNPLMIPLTKKQKQLLEAAKRLGTFTAKKIEPYSPYVLSKLYPVLHELKEYGFLKSESMEDEHSWKPVTYYTYQEFHLDKIPKWKDIEDLQKKGN